MESIQIPQADLDLMTENEIPQEKWVKAFLSWQSYNEKYITRSEHERILKNLKNKMIRKIYCAESALLKIKSFVDLDDDLLCDEVEEVFQQATKELRSGVFK